MNRLRVAGRVWLIVVVCVLAASLAEAQSTGRVEGSIVDADKRPIGGAIVKARHAATDTTYTVESNSLGQYAFSALPPGPYEITVSAPSFAPAILTVEVAMAAVTTADFDPSTPKVRARPIRSGLQALSFEASGHLGWTFSDGVSGDSVKAANGNIYNRIDPANSVSWGFTFGVFITRRLEAEFLFDRQSSTLQVSGTNTVDVGGMSIGNYHGILSFNLGAEGARVQPYLFGGGGATTYSSLTFTGSDGKKYDMEGRTRMSPTFGGGVKIYRGRVGARIEARLTPTYIKSDPGSWWCDPYWGCYIVENVQYSNQFQISGGVTFRF